MVVFDASTLILLAKIELLEMFISSFKGKVVIPKTVKLEVCVECSDEKPFLESLIKESKIEVLAAKNPRQKRKLMDDFNIDEGEAEALLLALQSGAKLFATDDRNAIRASKLLKIDFVTAVGFLIRALEKELISGDEALIKLKKLQRIARYSNAILADSKQKIKEMSNNGGKNLEHTCK